MKNRSLFLSLTALATASLSHAQAAYTTGFESPGYTAGSTVVGADGWTAGSGSGASQSVTTGVSASGSQSLTFANTSTSSNSFYSVRHAYGFSSGTAYSVSTKVQLAGSTGSDRLYGLYLSTGTLGSTVLGMTISGGGAIRAGKTWGATYSTTGILATAGAGTFADRWLTLDFTVTSTGAATTKLSGFSDGSTYSFSFTGVTLGSTTNVQLGADYVGTTARLGTGYFDDLKVAPVPEPASMAALGLGVAAMLRRRRRSA